MARIEGGMNEKSVWFSVATSEKGLVQFLDPLKLAQEAPTAIDPFSRLE